MGHSAHSPAPFETVAKAAEKKVRKLVALGACRDFESHTFTIVRPLGGDLQGVILLSPIPTTEPED